jgi:hypothetical protein
LFLLAVWGARADNYEGYESSIDGVGLWWLDADEAVLRRLRFGENPEFAIYCDGKNKLFIYELSSQGFTCKTEHWSELLGWQNNEPWKIHDLSDKKKLLQTIELAKNDNHSNAGESEYFVSLPNVKIKSQGIFTVSKTKLVRGSWSVSAPTKDELGSSMKIAMQNLKSVHREKDYTYKSVFKYSNKGIKNLAGRQTAETYTLKIRSGGTEIILVPSLYEFQPLGGELISSVVLHDHDSYRFVGHIYGCLLSVGADLDSDGVPEVILENCDNSEGQSIKYVKLVPEIKSLVSYSHN